MVDDKKLNISLDEVFNDTKTLISIVKQELFTNKVSKDKITLIIPCRGWEIIGSLLKNALWLDESQILRLKFSNSMYSWWDWTVTIPNEKENVKFNDYAIYTSKKRLTIFIDDLIDSGLTIDYVKKQIKGPLITSVLYSKEWKNREKVDFCVKELENKWVIFPWEEFYIKD